MRAFWAGLYEATGQQAQEASIPTERLPDPRKRQPICHCATLPQVKACAFRHWNQVTKPSRKESALRSTALRKDSDSDAAPSQVDFMLPRSVVRYLLSYNTFYMKKSSIKSPIDRSSFAELPCVID